MNGIERCLICGRTDRITGMYRSGGSWLCLDPGPCLDRKRAQVAGNLPAEPPASGTPQPSRAGNLPAWLREVGHNLLFAGLYLAAASVLFIVFSLLIHGSVRW